MAPASRLDEWIHGSAWIFLFVAIAIVGILWRGAISLPSPVSPPTRLENALPAGQAGEQAFDESIWNVFENSMETVELATDPLSKRFRLAGTFFAFGGGQTDRRQAILDDLQSHGQLIVSENEPIGGDVLVVRIESDRILLRSGDREELLQLSFSASGTGGAAAPGGAETAGTSATEDAPFGRKQLGDNRWQFSRQAILDYYAALREEPERLVKVFDSLAPVYTRGGQIEGYQLQTQGEKEFFDAIGLNEGDIVRSVNSMEMTSRVRAEYFIREFVMDRANAFVLDIERSGRKEKLIYQVR